MKVYVVTMYRWGDRENHSYVLGVWDDKDVAIEKGKEEISYRGGKYEPEVISIEINSPSSIDTVYDLNKNVFFDS